MSDHDTAADHWHESIQEARSQEEQAERDELKRTEAREIDRRIEEQQMAAIEPLPNCPRCNVAPELHHLYGYSLTCPGCFDTAEDLTSGLYAAGITQATAEQRWCEVVAEYIEDNAP